MNINYFPWRIYQFVFKKNKIHPTAWIDHRVRLGRRNTIYSYVVIGSQAEHKNPENLSNETYIYHDNIIREFVTINAGTTGWTVIDHNCYIMAHAHVGHDSWIKHNVVLSTGCKIGGHSIVGQHSYIGLNAVTHQRSWFPPSSILGASSFFKNKNDYKVTPEGKYAGVPARWLGENIRR
jgi:UDP-N-acetylglucosamine acyltransferase